MLAWRDGKLGVFVVYLTTGDAEARAIVAGDFNYTSFETDRFNMKTGTVKSDRPTHQR